MLDTIYEKYPYLAPDHPLAKREMSRVQRQLPTFIRKLSDIWTMIAYAAVVHGVFFMLSLIGYGRFFSGMPVVLMPFLTPFGTPLAMAMLHSILYWFMLIGVCNYTVFLVGRDVESQTWSILRTTPYAGRELLMAKLGTVARVWSQVLKTLLITRASALILIPAVLYFQQQASDLRPVIVLNFITISLFIVQPLIDAFLVASLSTVCSLMSPNTLWAKVSAYGLIAMVYGLLGIIGSFWMIFQSPLGTVGGILAPLSHWALLIGAMVQPVSQTEFLPRILILTIIYIVLPLIIGLGAFKLAIRLAEPA